MRFFPLSFFSFFLMFIVSQSLAHKANENIIRQVDLERDSLTSVFPSSEIIHINRKISFKGTIFTLGLVQSVYLGGYIVTQHDNIKQNGSFKNWRTNIPMLIFDKDSYVYNIIAHVGIAQYSYLFYRALGYTKINSFALTAIGSTVFEFFIETYTEPPSIQDLWQTPVLGSLLGMGMESLSIYLLNRDRVITDVIGYILNPFAMLPFSSYDLHMIPVISENFKGISLSINLR